MKYTICITQECNLACTYCYIGKKPVRLDSQVATAVIDFIFENTPPGEPIDIGFFGGEPLLEFDLIKTATQLITEHPAYSAYCVRLTLVTNGTIFSPEIAHFLIEHQISFCLSCDGPATVHDRFRRFVNGNPSSATVEHTLRQALQVLPSVVVNAVYRPETLACLPEVVSYFASIGLKQIYLNPDYSANWRQAEIDLLTETYRKVADIYIDSYLKHQPLFISLLDSKITILLRGGYQPEERCNMGRGELAFTPDGRIFPCERLIGSGEADQHCLGNIQSGIFIERLGCFHKSGGEKNMECFSCGIKDYCMNWCGCSNFFASGFYNRVSPFICHSERAAVETAFRTFEFLEKRLGAVFLEHLSGSPQLNSLMVEKLKTYAL